MPVEGLLGFLLFCELQVLRASWKPVLTLLDLGSALRKQLASIDGSSVRNDV